MAVLWNTTSTGGIGLAARTAVQLKPPMISILTLLDAVDVCTRRAEDACVHALPARELTAQCTVHQDRKSVV